MASHPYTCLSCALAFASAALQRSHYSTELHRYNAKRKVAGLPPISHDAFAAIPAPDAPRSALECKPCSRSFASQSQLDHHLSTKKHKLAAADKGKAPARLAVATPVTPDSCLFCSCQFPVHADKVAHMLAAHGFFIPDADYLVDPQGFLAHLAEMINVGAMCIYCKTTFGGYFDEDVEMSKDDMDRKMAKAADSTRKHMCDKNHCKVPWDTEKDRLALSDYYDFTTSYDTLPAKPAPMAVDGDDDGWESASDVGSDADVVEMEDDYIPDSGVMYGDTEYELVLPSGKRIGHRKLKDVYRQNILPYLFAEERNPSITKRLAEIASKGPEDVPSNALIPTNSHQSLILTKNAGEAKYATRDRATYTEMRKWSQEYTRKAIKYNNHQKHYRDHLLQ